MVKNLKALRMERGISQQQLADAISVTQPSIHKYETQSVEPEISILIQLADYFNTSVDYLIGHTDERRRIERTETFALNPQEAAMLHGYRQLHESERRCINLTIEAFNHKN